jgi:RimJ/RimL family protein N-acetyltransferase
VNIAVTTRPVRPDDRSGFCRMWPRLSRETIYRRFHAPIRVLPSELVDRLVTVDHAAREAVVGVVGGEVVGVARYDRSPINPDSAEIAILVEDAWQGVGLGRQLLRELTDLAQRRGVRTLTATVQPDNDRVIGLIRRLLPGSTFRDDEDVLAVESHLPATTAGRLAPLPV